MKAGRLAPRGWVGKDRGDRVGFLGLTEVTRVMSIEHFFDFYLRSMHFTPCALIAFNGTIFHCATYEIIGLVSALILASAPCHRCIESDQ